MIEELRIQNFQCHEKFAIQFDPHLTVLIGDSDQGKSAVIRALRWVCRNFPQGEEFIQEGKKGTTVQVLVDGRCVKRRRGKGDNSYHLDGEEFKSFGTDLPDTIRNILNLDDVNFQTQVYNPKEPINSQPTFWFSLSPAEVSRQLNSVVDLGIIDSSLSAIAKKVRYFQQAVQISRGRLTKAKEEKENLDWVVDSDADFQRVEFIESEKASVSLSHATLQKTVEDARRQQKVQEEATQKAEQAYQTGQIGKQAKRVADNREKLKSVVNEIKRQADILERAKQRPDISQLQEIIDCYNRIKGKLDRLQDMLSEIERMRKRQEQLNRESKEAYEELESQSEGICPVCGSGMSI